jgi:4-hydroxyphenylacetate 3-monooxygenase
MFSVPFSPRRTENNCTSEFDSPLACRDDEADNMLLCKEVKAPWERVLVHDDALLSPDVRRRV